MKRDELLKQCKYYKGEENNPFKPGTTDSLWWNGEKQLCDTVEQDSTYFDALLDEYKQAQNDCSGVLADKSVPLNKRAIIFYLDLWHGRYFPYDSLDVIFTY